MCVVKKDTRCGDENGELFRSGGSCEQVMCLGHRTLIIWAPNPMTKVFVSYSYEQGASDVLRTLVPRVGAPRLDSVRAWGEMDLSMGAPRLDGVRAWGLDRHIITLECDNMA